MTDLIMNFKSMLISYLDSLPDEERDQNKVCDCVEEYAPKFEPLMGRVFSSDEKSDLVKELETMFSVTMDDPQIFSSPDYRPWLADVKSENDSAYWYYWNRYKMYLKKKQFNPKVLNKIDNITDKILDHMENPLKEGKWDRKGMVVGDVQSGKTANYTGLITKAADSGYRIIIVLAGILNSLRSQTQTRIDEGFIGFSSDVLNPNEMSGKDVIGVGRFEKTRRPAAFTDSNDDFKIEKVKMAKMIPLENLIQKEPVVLVIKKNVSTIRNLHSWFKTNNDTLKSYPILIIDDEADQASINTNKDETNPTAINKGLRQLLSLFSKSSFLGYTATPFANIFIDKEPEDDNLQHSLFPKDFIINLESPSNYIGPSVIFSENPIYPNLLQEITDAELFIPTSHKKDFIPNELSDSLKEAILSFVIIQTVRIVRNQGNKHNSMMINVSRFTDVQSNIKDMVQDYIYGIKNVIENYAGLSHYDFISKPFGNDIFTCWEDRFDDCKEDWEELQPNLYKAISKITVIEVNASKNSEKLDYSEKNYPNGRSLIAVGGLSLSRGITLEGLSVSYFLRNSKMYDTLMQMGRWFGYRPGYADLCRVYMTEPAMDWYSYIASVLKELREDFDEMSSRDLTPKDYGLKIKSHPESLIVTARNKMRSGTKQLLNINLAGQLVETSVLKASEDDIEHNQQAVIRLINEMNEIKSPEKTPSLIWSEIPLKLICQFMDSFKNHEESIQSDPVALSQLLNERSRITGETIDVVLYSIKKTDSNRVWSRIPDIVIPYQKRTLGKDSSIESDSLYFSKRRVASKGAEKIILKPLDIYELETQYFEEKNKTNYPDKLYRQKFKRPLLMIHLIECHKNKDDDSPMYPEHGVVAWGLSFPKDEKMDNKENPYENVPYIVNTTWWKNKYLYLFTNQDEDLSYEE